MGGGEKGMIRIAYAARERRIRKRNTDVNEKFRYAYMRKKEGLRKIGSPWTSSKKDD